jgi:hypothetical protein
MILGVVVLLLVGAVISMLGTHANAKAHFTTVIILVTPLEHTITTRIIAEFVVGDAQVLAGLGIMLFATVDGVESMTH